MGRLGEAARRRLNTLTDRVVTLPLLVLMPHSRCNARCLMCDIWKANADKRELSTEEIAAILPDLRRLNVQRVVFSGGEALLHKNLWTLAAMIRSLGARITLLSTGLTVRDHAAEIARWCDEVVLSLDGTPAIHDAIRNVPSAYERLAAGVRALRAERRELRVTGRSVVQRRNFASLPGTLETARELGLDSISFLPVDVGTQAFGRLNVWGQGRVDDVALTSEDVAALRGVVERVIRERPRDFATGFIAESPAKLRRIPDYFAALLGAGAFPSVTCNAPWFSAVLEADGTVRPCFFQPAIGDIREDASLAGILNSPRSVAFRRDLDVATDPICNRCVCSLSVGLTTAI